jgi:hypothetical protein
MSDSDLGFHLDLGGGAEVLKGMAAGQIAAIAASIAAKAGPDAEVTHDITDRARATVKVPAHQQAKDGALSRAAAGAGVKIVQLKPRQRRPRGEARAKKAKK